MMAKHLQLANDKLCQCRKTRGVPMRPLAIEIVSAVAELVRPSLKKTVSRV